MKKLLSKTLAIIIVSTILAGTVFAAGVPLTTFPKPGPVGGESHGYNVNQLKIQSTL